jgi:hypothetical protein
VEPDDSHVRASDADRERTAGALHHHCAEGRLSVDEFEERLARLYTSRTLGDLRGVLSELPDCAPPSEQTEDQSRRRRRGLPAARPFVQQHRFRDAADVVLDEAVAAIVPAMTSVGFNVSAHTNLGIIVFEQPALWRRRRMRQHVIVGIEECAGGSSLTVHGVARRPVRRAFAAVSAGEPAGRG